MRRNTQYLVATMITSSLAVYRRGLQGCENSMQRVRDQNKGQSAEAIFMTRSLLCLFVLQEVQWLTSCFDRVVDHSRQRWKEECESLVRTCLPRLELRLADASFIFDVHPPFSEYSASQKWVTNICSKAVAQLHVRGQQRSRVLVMQHSHKFCR